MNGLHFRKSCKHWSKSPAFVSLDQSVFRVFLDTPTYDLTTPQAIQTKAIITSKLQLKTKKGGRV
jgi:hypothetical protein